MSEISPSEAKALIDADAQIVDVRETDEWEAGRIPGARHITLDRVQAAAADLEQERALIIYCRGGERSAMAADAFSSSGWDAHSITGGLVAWAEAGLPLEPEDGQVAERSGLPPR